MGAPPLKLVHIILDFADLPELHAEAEVHVFSRVLRPVGYVPLTGKHNMDGISTVSWLWHRDKGIIPGAAPLPTMGRQERPGTHRVSAWIPPPQHRKDQSVPLQVVCAASTPNRELPFPVSWAFNSILGLHCKLNS